jgi:hypothetical protein
MIAFIVVGLMVCWVIFVLLMFWLLGRKFRKEKEK